MKLSRKTILAGVCAFAATLGLAGGIQRASAAERRVHSSQCHYYYDNADTGVYNGSYLYSSGATRTMYCPAPSDSALPHYSTTTLNVHGYEPSGGSAYSRACVKYYNNSGGSCGAIKYWGSGYNGAYGVSTSSWTSSVTGMPYIYHSIPSGGSLYGFYMSN